MHEPTYRRKFVSAIDPRNLIRLTQMRKTYRNIPLLAENIGSNGLMHNPGVALLSPSECATYLDMVNRLWGSDHELDHLPFAGHPWNCYPVVFYGHRRTCALDHLLEHGCESWRERYPGLGPTDAFEARFGACGIEMTMYEGISASTILDMQFSENTPEMLPLLEDAQAVYDLWNFRKLQDPGLSITAFSQRIGRGENAVRDRVHFFDLPLIVQQAVRDEVIEWGHAKELRGYFYYLRERPDSDPEQALEKMLALIIEQKELVKPLRGRIKREIARIEAGQKDFGELWYSSPEEQAGIEEEMQTAGSIKEYSHQVRATLGYLEKLAWLHRHGLISPNRSSKMRGSVQADIERIFESLELLAKQTDWLSDRQKNRLPLLDARLSNK